MYTRLSFYMKELNLSGKKISQIVHVDPSLVSKWKSGRRLLRKSSTEAKLLSNYLLKIDNKLEESYFESCFANVNELLEEYVSANSVTKQRMLKDLFCEDGDYPFLKPKIAKTKINNISIKDEIQVSRDVKIMITNFIKDTSESKYIEFHLLGEAEWIYEFIRDPDIYDFLDKSSKCTRLEMSIGIIGNNKYSKDTKVFKSMKLLLPILNKQQFKLSLAYIQEQGNKCYLIGEGVGILQAISLQGEKFPNAYVQYINDTSLVDYYSKYLKNETRKQQNFGRRYKRSRLKEVLDLIQHSGKQKDHSFFISTQLFFTSMDKDLLEEVMTYNNVSTQSKSLIIKLYDSLNSNFSNNISVFDNHHIYNYDALFNLCKEDEFIYDHLTLILNKPIHMTRRHFIRHIKDTIRREECNPNYYINIVKDDIFNKIVTVDHVWLKDSIICMMWYTDVYAETVIIDDQVFIWQMINEIENMNGYKMSYEQMLRQFNKIINQAIANDNKKCISRES